jgi:hypothetical protein
MIGVATMAPVATSASTADVSSRAVATQPIPNSLMLKNRPRRDHQTRLARSAHQLDRDDAVATKRKKIVVNPDPLNPQYLRK